ncbi:hypothetical protein GDO86_015476 [Hymenochirus boettgeri]|uniref:Uncharacterized protein n=1 Tax=Hymenochirus boettgeri TaxID=247094 RepID=A0A8T2JT26_9PIPI|nr:hypothetical protein GDO86_015476 [Hymenochirus boettgeri]
MRSWNSWLLSSTLCLLLVLTSSEPSCENEQDFQQCSGHTGNFCPNNIPCICVNRQPQCSCPYYKGPKGDYWYMGAKCDQLWTTHDLILVTVLPAVTLAVVVAVTAQIIHACKAKSSKKTGRNSQQHTELVRSHHNHNQQQSQMEHSTNFFQNHAFVPSTNQEYVSNTNLLFVNQVIPKTQMASQAGRSTLAPGQSAPQEYHTNQSMAEGPINRISNNPYFQPKPQFGNSDVLLPDEDYNTSEITNHLQNRLSGRLSSIGVPVLPQADYRQPAAESTSNSQKNMRPFVITRPQIKNDYGY